MMNNNDILILTVLATIKRNRLILVSVFIVSLVVAYTLVRFTPKKYTVQSTLVISGKDNNGLERLFDSQSSILKSSGGKSNELILLKSRTLLRECILESNSNFNFYYKNRLGFNRKCVNRPVEVSIDHNHVQLLGSNFKVEIIDQDNFILSYQGDNNKLGWVDSTGTPVEKDDVFEYYGEHQFGEQITTPHTSFRITKSEHTPSQGMYFFEIIPIHQFERQIRNSLVIEPYSKDSKAINVLFTYHDINQAIKLVDTLIDKYLKKDVQNNKLMYKTQVDFINNRIDGIVNDLYQSEIELENFQRKNKSIDLDYTSQKIYDALFVKEKEKEALEYKLSYYKHIQNQISSEKINEIIIPSIVGEEDATLIGLVNELSQINIELKEAGTKFSDDNPIYSDKYERGEFLRNSISSLIKNGISNIVLNIDGVNEIIIGMEKEMLALPKSQGELIKIKRDFELNNEIYTFLLEKRAESNIQMASTFSDKKIVDKAMLVNENYTSPNKKLIFGVSIILFVGLTLVFIIGRSILFAKVDSIEIIKKYVPEVAYLGDVPQCKSSEVSSEGMIEADSIMFEKIRMLISNLKFVLRGSSPAVVGVTSFIQGEGKSFVAKNICNSLSVANNKVLFINGDLRKSTSEKSNLLGLSNYLAGTSSLEQIIVPSSNNSYSYMPAGPLPPNPGEMLESDEMVKLIETLKSSYDYIILDLPPVGIISDWNSVKNELDHTIYMLRDNYTPIESIQKLNDVETGKLSYVYNGSALKMSSYYNSYYNRGVEKN